MRQKLVAGNWKMNGSLESNKALIEGLLAGIGNIKSTSVAVCPSSIYISQVADLVKGSAIAVGGQDLNVNDSGAFTGEISGPMLNDFGCQFVLVGHSERRTIYGETNEIVADKYAAAQGHGLTPVLCVGELLEERENGTTEAVVGKQIDAVIEKSGVASFANAVIAYEPVWAIGTGKTASPEQAQDVHAFIRNKLKALDAGVAEKVQILYGGSVKGANAVELFSKSDIDGGLIGGAALSVDDFLAICSAGDQ